ncbi:YcdB/YcdC domain-containing protein [Brevibacillus sp. 179-C9.3 HS]|uniref:YcdB/YcdC domain-containing protein n=1 Tax=unclassified Brevibacillus TaxID=2684853 RepID=UPI0039A1A77D
MSLPDENHLIERLKQVRQESVPPRPEWKQMGKERLIREADRLQQAERFKRAVAGAGTFAAAVFIGVWMSYDSPLKPSADTQTAILPPAEMTVRMSPPLAIPSPSVESQSKPQQETTQKVDNKIVLNQTVAQDVSTPHPIAQESATKPEESTQPTPTRVKSPLEAKAEAFLHKKLGAQSSQFEVDYVHSNLAAGEVAFRKIINGIPLQENSAMVRISPKTGEMTLLLYPGFEDSVIAPQSGNHDKAIDKAKAAQQLASTLRLVYTGEEQPELRYMADSDFYVEAKTGNLITLTKAEKKSFAVTGQGEPPLLKTSQEVAELLGSKLGIKVEEKPFVHVEKHGISYSWSVEGNAVSVDTTDEGAFLGYAQLAANGQEQKRETTNEQAQALAIAHLEKFLPTDVRELSLEATHKSADIIQFTFAPIVNGIPVIDHPYRVSVELTSGLVTELTGNFAELSWTHNNQTIKTLSKEEALLQFVQIVPLELVYLPAENGAAPVLAYQIRRDSEQPWAMDARTGKAVN